MDKKYRHMLLVYPEFFPTYWGMQYHLPLVGRKALMPPLGLLTIAAMTPSEYECRVVDLNCGPLTQKDLDWADIVLMSAMLPQKKTLFRVADHCRQAGKLVVFGGPYPTACPEECAPHCDVLVLNEGEITWPRFLEDLEKGTWEKIYQTSEKPDVTQTPCPRFDLLDLSNYVSIPIQYSRGCPFQCEFCDIIVMFGRRPRTKTPAQLVKELDAIYDTGYRGTIFMVDDNFIGNKKEVQNLLPEIIKWNQIKGSPFYFTTEASVNLSEDPALMKQMVDANFQSVFFGIETPSMEGLKETHKFQNIQGSLVDRMRDIERAGILAMGGFIVGFDSDTPDIFDRQIAFIQEAAIPNAMVGPLVALPGTPLYARLQKEGRLIQSDSDEDRTIASGYTNIRTKIPRLELLRGHRKIISTIYEPANYFKRTLDNFSRMERPKTWRGRWEKFKWFGSVFFRISSRKQDESAAKKSPLSKIKAMRQTFKKFPEDYRKAVKRFLWQIILKCPEQLPRAFGYTFMGYHYYQFTRANMLPELDRELASLQQDALAEQKLAS